MKLSITLASAFAVAALAAPTPEVASPAAVEARWDYGSSNDKRDSSKTVARWDYGSTENKRDVTDKHWDYGKKKGEFWSLLLADTLLTTLVL